MSTTLPIYPGVPDSESLLLSTLGSFWSDQVADAGFLRGMMRAVATSFFQTCTEVERAENTLARATVPVFRTMLWLPLRLREDQMNASNVSVPTFGDGHVFGQASMRFGQAEAKNGLYVFPAPENIQIRNIAAIYNRIADPTSVLISGVDFVVDATAGALIFNRNPFADISAAIRTIGSFPGGAPIRECQLWAYSVTVDAQDIWNYIGYVLKLHGPSSEAYRDLCNAIMDSHVTGPTDLSFRRLFAAVAGIQSVRGTETVEYVLPGLKLQIVTDRSVYTFPGACTSAVKPGDVVGEGDILISDLRIVDCNAGGPGAAALDGLAAVAIGREFFGDTYFSPLVFLNTDLPLQYIGEADGQVAVRFPVLGFPTDVEMFWENVEARGQAAGHTLADALDTRQAGNGPPQPQNLPAFVNPAKLILGMLGNNLKLVRLSANIIDPQAPGLQALRFLHSALNPRMTFMVFIELELPEASATFEYAVDEGIETGYGADLGICTASEPVLTQLMAGMIEGVIL